MKKDKYKRLNIYFKLFVAIEMKISGWAGYLPMMTSFIWRHRVNFPLLRVASIKSSIFKLLYPYKMDPVEIFLLIGYIFAVKWFIKYDVILVI